MYKTQEALELAIKRLEKSNFELQGIGNYSCQIYNDKAIEACKEALAELALQEMAENAKELGLDYCKHGSDSACKECYMEQTK